MPGVTNKLPDGLTEVDIIIAGGGTAGCVVAARLSDADPNLSILVIEGGDNNYNDPTIVNPALFLSHIMPTSKTTLFYQGSKEASLGDREVVVQSGGVLGGGSSINIMTYSRAQRHDYDAWNTPGWTANDLLPYMKKLETYHGEGTDETHGKDGPIQVSRGTFTATRSQNDFLQAAAKLDWPEAADIQNLDTNNHFQRNLTYISPDGKRQDAAHRYLHPRLLDGKHPNLHVVVQHQVNRVLCVNKKAVGVEFHPNSRFLDDTTVSTVRARKLVIVSCGALGTPLVLERSGLGGSSVLSRAGVEVVAELPGVGQNYLDHHLLAYPYHSSLEAGETLDEIYGGRIAIPDLFSTGDRRLGWNASDVTSKVRPSDAEVSALGPDFRAAWDKDFKDNPNKPVAIITTLNVFPGDPTGLPVAQFMSVSTFTVYPYSRGSIHITGPTTSDPVDFKTGFLADANGIDVKKSMWAYKKQREIMRRMKAYRGEYAAGHPPFAASSNAACIETEGALTNVKDIVYTTDDDEVLDKWIRQHVASTWHSMGTCKMASREELGVVDASLGVHGIAGLKLADLSIAPKNIAANTANAAFVIGEKAADIFIKELGLGQ